MTIRKTMLAASIALASIGAAPVQTANPVRSVVQTADKSHILGDPKAKALLTEYVSYTCGLCATFEREGADLVKMQYVASGRMRFEVRHYLLNIADLAVASAVHCLPADKFFTVHSAMLKRQGEWAPKFFGATPAQQARYESGTAPQRLRAVASDIGLYDMMTNQGLSRAQLDQCLGNPDIYGPIVAQTTKAETRGVTGTPTFELNGARLPSNTAQGVSRLVGAALKAAK